MKLRMVVEVKLNSLDTKESPEGSSVVSDSRASRVLASIAKSGLTHVTWQRDSRETQQHLVPAM